MPESCERVIRDGGVRAYVFRGAGRFTAVAWSSETPARLAIGGAARAYDIMGNELPPGERPLDASPVYLVGQDADAIVKAIAPAK